MADNDNDEDPEQLKLMKRMVELAVEQVELARKRTDMSADRSKMSADRSRMSEDRSRMSADRSELSAERSYMNAERTLSVWVRTALALMVFGIAIDRFGLFLYELPQSTTVHRLYSDELSTIIGAALVAFGALVAVVTGIRFLLYSRTYHRSHRIPYHHGPYLASFFALLAAGFGVALLLLMLVFFP